MDAVEGIWREYHHKLHGFILNRVGDPSVADDILQDVFARIHSRISTLRDSGRIQSWIYQITRNAVIDHYRSQKSNGNLPGSFSTPEMEPSDLTRQEIEGWFLPMIELLPDQYREAVKLSEIDGLTHKEATARLGLSLSAVKSRIRRGRIMLKGLLLECCHFELDHRGKVVDYRARGDSHDCCSK